MEISNSNFFNIGSPCEICSPLKKLNWNIGHIYSIGCKKHNNYSHEYTEHSQQKEKKSHKLFWVVNLDFWIRATCVNPDRLAFWLMKQFYSHIAIWWKFLPWFWWLTFIHQYRILQIFPKMIAACWPLLHCELNKTRKRTVILGLNTFCLEVKKSTFFWKIREDREVAYWEKKNFKKLWGY